MVFRTVRAYHLPHTGVALQRPATVCSRSRAVIFVFHLLDKPDSVE